MSMKRPKLSMTIMPHTTPALFKQVFAAAHAKWPGKKLGLIGTAPNGDAYLQEWANPNPYILTSDEFEPKEYRP